MLLLSTVESITGRGHQIMIICGKQITVSKCRPFYWFSFHVIAQYHENEKKKSFPKEFFEMFTLGAQQSKIQIMGTYLPALGPNKIIENAFPEVYTLISFFIDLLVN